jgi:hypothetical protein
VQEEILEAMPEAGLRIYAIYFEMVEGDRGAKSRVKPADLFTDPRVTVFWDEGKVAGRWFDEHVTKLGAREGAPGRIEWDAFVLYGPEARWSGESSEHVSWGRPLAQEAGRLKMDLDGVI